MHTVRSRWICGVCAALLASGCAKPSKDGPAAPRVTRIDEGAGAQKQAQTALINAKPGDVIDFGPGRFEFTSTLSLDVNNVTIRGRGHDKTILAFNQQGQGTGGEGILITSKEKVTIQDLAVEDAKGDAIKVNGCNGITFRSVRTSWSGGPKETNGDVRAVSRALQGRVDRRLHRQGCLGCGDLRRPVGKHHRATQSGREQRGRHRNREFGECRRV